MTIQKVIDRNEATLKRKNEKAFNEIEFARELLAVLPADIAGHESVSCLHANNYVTVDDCTPDLFKRLARVLRPVLLCAGPHPIYGTDSRAPAKDDDPTHGYFNIASNFQGTAHFHRGKLSNEYIGWYTLLNGRYVNVRCHLTTTGSPITWKLGNRRVFTRRHEKSIVEFSCTNHMSESLQKWATFRQEQNNGKHTAGASDFATKYLHVYNENAVDVESEIETLTNIVWGEQA